MLIVFCTEGSLNLRKGPLVRFIGIVKLVKKATPCHGEYVVVVPEYSTFSTFLFILCAK